MAAGSTYTPIANYTVSTATTSIVFSSISSAYTDLIVIGNSISGGVNICVQFNSDTGTNYSLTQLYGDGTTASSLRGSNLTYIYGGVIGNYSSTKLNIMNYSNTTTYKTAIARGGTAGNYVDASVGLWRSTAAINSIKLLQDPGGSGSWQPGSTFTLWGILNA